VSELSPGRIDASIDDTPDVKLPLASQRIAVILRPADLFAISVPTLFGLLVVTNGSRHPEWRLVAAELFGVAIGGFLCRMLASNSKHPLAQLFGNFYCILTIWVSYSRLNPIIDQNSPVTWDRELQAADMFLFGVQPSVWLERIHAPLLTEIAFICYFAFFIWQLSLGILLYLRKNGDFDDYFLTVIAFYMLSYCGYVMIPAIGPRFDIAHEYTVPLQGLWLADSIKALFTDIPMVRDCFPSGHTGLTLLVLIRAWQKKARLFFWIMLPCATLLIFATVYCRFHYVTDLLCAIPFIAGVLCVDKALRHLLPEGLMIAVPSGAWWRSLAVRRTA
jgi:membrane-associated phospholipid phosphatase